MTEDAQPLGKADVPWAKRKEHTLVVEAVDLAGNTGEAMLAFRVR